MEGGFRYEVVKSMDLLAIWKRYVAYDGPPCLFPLRGDVVRWWLKWKSVVKGGGLGNHHRHHLQFDAPPFIKPGQYRSVTNFASIEKTCDLEPGWISRKRREI